jgi:hypothetical protein
VRWTDEDTKTALEMHKAGKSAATIAKALKRTPSGVDNRIHALRKQGTIEPSTRRNSAVTKKQAVAPKTNGKAADGTDRGKNKHSHGNLRATRWTEAEDALLFELKAKGKLDFEAIVARVNKRFKNDRTVSGSKQRLNILKTQANGGPLRAGRKKNGLARVSEVTPITHLDSVTKPLPVAEERHLRIDFPDGAIGMSISGQVPEATKRAVSEILWS